MKNWLIKRNDSLKSNFVVAHKSFAMSTYIDQPVSVVLEYVPRVWNIGFLVVLTQEGEHILDAHALNVHLLFGGLLRVQDVPIENTDGLRDQVVMLGRHQDTALHIG